MLRCRRGSCSGTGTMKPLQKPCLPRSVYIVLTTFPRQFLGLTRKICQTHGHKCLGIYLFYLFFFYSHMNDTCQNHSVTTLKKTIQMRKGSGSAQQISLHIIASLC